MEIWEEFRKYINEHAKELEDQIAAEEAAMTEEERAADKLRQERFAKKMMELAKKKACGRREECPIVFSI